MFIWGRHSTGSGYSVVDPSNMRRTVTQATGNSNLGESCKGCLQVFVTGNAHLFEGVGELSQSRLLQDLSKV